MDGLTHRFAAANGIRFHYVEAGAGSPILFLHGFPEFWYAWRHQIPALAAAGFRAFAPDLRGYNLTERPTRVVAYRPKILIADIAAFIEEVIREPVFLVGHDWGGVLAWRCAALHSRLVRKLVILNAPHPAAREDALRAHPRLWLQTLYMVRFQIPILPEQILRSGDFARLETVWRREPVHPHAFTDADIARYKSAFSAPDALTGPLNYYRAAFRFSRDLLDPPQIVSVPTLVLWGEQDPYLHVRLIDSLPRYVPNLEVRRIFNSSHWIQNDIPNQINRDLLAFLTR